MKLFLICCFFGLCAYSFHGVQGCGAFQTKYGENFGKACDSGKSLVKVGSAHSSEKKDRVWSFYCRDNSYITTSCAWSLPANQYVNSYDGTVNFICSGEGYMVGMYGADHSNYYGDRKFDFKCCDAKPGLGQSGCKWTDYVNDWKGIMSYDAPSGYYIAGAYSTHMDYHEDRRWKFYICQ